MSLRLRSARTIQLVTVAMLFTSVAQIAYWLIDEATYMEHVLEDRLAHYEQEARVARSLVADGYDSKEILAHFPALAIEGRQVAVRTDVVEDLGSARRDRLVRYGSEGTFLLIVLVAGIATLSYTLRQPNELLQRQENFIAAVSHEFKTPIASLKLSAETLLLREMSPENQNKLADRMLEETERLESMVTNILEAGTIAAGRLKLRPEDLQLHDVLPRLAERHACRASLQGVALKTSVAPELAIHCDRSAFEMIIDNLLSNATKSAVAKGGGQIDVNAKTEGRGVLIEVIDTGQGFDPREEKKLFEKFYRPGEEIRRKTKGSGLGLHVVKTLVEGSGGKVSASSAGEGTGATFRLWMPRAQGDTA